MSQPGLDAILAASIALLGAWLCLRLLLSANLSKALADQPNQRSLHSVPVPRIGGLGFFAGVLVATWAMSTIAQAVLLPAFLLALVSWVDDFRGLRASVRLVFHIGAAILFLTWPSTVVAVPYALGILILIVWMTNLYNFMDGSDGLAGVMALIGFGVYSLVAAAAGERSIAVLAGAIAGSSVAFLWFNLHPARIFLGDVGSIPLGFLAAAVGVLGYMKNVWPAWFPVVLFAPFVVDATVTLLRRLVRGEKVWTAHRGHYYQRLVLMGWGHRKTFVAEAIAMAMTALVAVWGLKLAAPWLIVVIAGWHAIIGVVLICIDSRWAKFSKRANKAI